MSPLSPRQQAVVTLLAAGETYKTIADRLGMSINTVGVHACRAARKLGLANRYRVVVAVKKSKHGPVTASSLTLWTEEDGSSGANRAA